MDKTRNKMKGYIPSLYKTMNTYELQMYVDIYVRGDQKFWVPAYILQVN